MAAPAATFVGRQRELSAADAALDAVQGGAFTAVAVEGEPGIGKTRVLGELRARAAARGYLVVAGSAAEFERDMPFGVLVDALDPLLDADAVAGFGEDAIGELARIFPALRASAPAPAVGDERYRAHRAARGLLERLAERRPLLLALDDVHWADDASLELLASLLRRPPPARVLIAVAFRAGEAPSRLAGALAAGCVERIALLPLSEPEAASLLGDRVDKPARAALYREAGGNPFYLEQLRRWKPETARTGDRSGAVPPAVAASLAAELAALPSEARALLQGAAVTGETFDPDLAGAAAELNPGVALEALDRLLERELVRPTGVPRRFVLRHPLVRRAVYDSAPGGWRLGAHARIARALAARGASAAERAHHAEHAAVQGDEEAIALLVEAASEVGSRAPAAAAGWLGAALRLLPAGERDRRIELLAARADALRSAGDLEGCRAALLDALALGGGAELTAACAAVEHWLGRHDDAGARLERAWREHAEADAARLAIEIAVDRLFALDFERTREMGELALSAATDPPLAAWAATVLYIAAAVDTRTAEAWERRAVALPAIEALSDAQLAHCLDAVYHLAWAETYVDRYEESLRWSERGLAVARAFGHGHMTVPLMLSRLHPLQMLGRLPEALETGEAAAESARLAGNPQHLWWALWECAYAHWLIGDLEEAHAAARESAEAARGRGRNLPGSSNPGWVAGLTRAARGDPEGGLRELLDAVGGPEGRNVMPAELPLMLRDVARIELGRGALDAAGEYVRRAAELAAKLNRPLAVAMARSVEAEVALGRAVTTPGRGDDAAPDDDGAGAARAVTTPGRGDDAAAGSGGAALTALAAADAAIAAAERAGAKLELAVARSLRGRALAAAGDRDAGVAALREAEAALDACGARADRDRARRELRRLGARVEPRGPAAGAERGLDALSPREREIAGLVRDRATNGQIAARLYLSEKTVETHLRNVFRKLGVASRVEVARAVEREASGP
jgi:DNA-binding CsgD family transcriptional regulator